MNEIELLSRAVLISTFLIGFLSGGLIFVIVGALNSPKNRGHSK